ncbi:MAG: apolipoprotein N-acyltransferase [Desulfuromonas sp.]|nr:apolipoprotein N-acyltransferase [Desulfuromonas sp.]
MKLDKNDVVAAFAGLVSALSFMWPYSALLAGLNWVSLAPLIFMCEDKPWRRGLVAGVCFFAPVLYWLNHVMVDYGGLPVAGSIVLYLLLVVYLALFWGATCWCSARIVKHAPLQLWQVFPFVWIAFEFLRSKLLTGFPWGSIIYSQAALPILVQSADIGGMWLPMLILLLVNCVVAILLHSIWRKAAAAPLGVLLVLAAGAFSLNAAYGIHAVERHAVERHAVVDAFATLAAESGEAAESVLSVALIQANIDQHQKWLSSNIAHTVRLYTDMSRQHPQADLIVWPESATPFFYQDGSSYAVEVDAVAEDLGANILFGSPAYVANSKGFNYFNSAYLLDANAELLGRTDKVHLVPFGEYVPLGSLLDFVDKLATGVGDFRPGTLQLLPLHGRAAGVLICYESIFPELARVQVQMGAQLLFNLTNDAWFGDTPAPHQHLQMARFRALENRRWLARCANTGVSTLIDPAGMLHGSTEIFRAGVVTGNVTFHQTQTTYTRCGDILAWLAVFLCCGWMWQSRKKRLSARR